MNLQSEFYRFLFEESPVPLVIREVHTDQRRGNAAFFRLLGSSPEEVGAMDFALFFLPEDVTAHEACYREMLSGAREAYSFLHPLRRADGATIHVRTHSRVLRDDSGHPLYVLTAFEDVSDLVEAMRSFRHERESLQALMDAIPDLIAFTDMEGKILRLNRAKARQLGAAVPEEVVGKRIADLEGRGEEPPFAERVVLPLTGPLFNVEERLCVPVLDGEPRWFLTSVAPLTIEGRVQGYITVSRDITERKEREQALKTLDETLRVLLSSAPNAIVILDREGNVSFWNLAAERLFGRRAEEMLAKPFSPLPDVELGEVLRAEGVMRNAEMTLTAPDGTERSLYVSLGALYDAHGKPNGMVAVYTDISERKRYEKVLAEREQLFRTIFEASPIGISLVNERGVFLLANRALEDILGYTEAELCSLSEDITFPEDVEPGLTYWRELVAGEREVFRVEKRVRRKDGEIRVVSWTAAAVRDEKGNFLYSVHLTRDITDQKQKEETLRQFSRAVESTGDSVLITNREGIVEYVNPAFESLTGYSAAEVLGKTPRILKSGKHDRAFYERFWGEILEGRTFRDVFINRKKTGELYYEDKTTSPVFDASGNLTHFVSVGRDVSRQREMRNALRESEARLRALFEASPIGILVHKCADGTTSVNDALANMIGYPKEEITGVLLTRITHPDDVEKTLQYYEELVAGSRSHYAIEKRYFRSDGSLVWARVSGVAVRDAREKLLYLVFMIEDITEWKRVQEALAASEARFRSLVESTDDLIAVVGEDLRIQGVFGRMLKADGRSADDFVGKKPTEVWGPEIGAFLEAGEQRALRGESVTLEWRMPVRGGFREIQSLMSPIFSGGRVIGVVCVGRDITPLKRAAENLRQMNLQLERRVRERTRELEETNARLAHSNEELQQFTYVVSHDLQEPLRTVAGFVDLIQRRYREQFDTPLQGYFAYIAEGVQRAQRMIRSLLEYSRLNARPHEPVPVEVEDVLQAVCQDLSERLRECNGSVLWDSPLPRVLADPVQLHQLLLNLIGNGIKFRRENPPRVHFSATRESEEMWRFAVRDNGIGIPESQLQRIFLVFQRVHRREDYEGEGIGLAICRKIVLRHGGRIWAESTLGEGSTFYFTLPSAP